MGRRDLVAGKKRIFGHHNTIGNIFCGSDGYLATGDEGASSYEMWLSNQEGEQYNLTPQPSKSSPMTRGTSF